MKIDPIYQELMESFGISSREENIKKIFVREITKHPEYELIYDNLGSVFAYKKSKNKDAKTVMIAGHMDEVGLMVSDILKNGAIKLIPIGGIDPQVFLSQLVYIDTGKHHIPGVIGAIPPHITKDQKVSFEAMVLDTGMTQKELIEAGVALGDMVLPKTPFIYNHNEKRIIAKAVDNRWGCGMALELIKDLAKEEFEFDLVIGATVQEEVGLRGAGTSAYTVNPDLFIALDASPLNDINDPNQHGKMDEGFLIRLYDPSNIMKPSLLSYFKEVAIKHAIKHQIYFSKGGTDAARALITKKGIPATTIGLPARYIHSTVSMFSIEDHFSAHAMLRALINELTNEKITYLKTH